MDDQALAADGTTDQLEVFIQAIRRVRGWKSATSERVADDRVLVTNLKAGMWLECRYREGGERGFMTVGREETRPFFEREWFLPTPAFTTFRARQLVQGVRQWERRAVLRQFTLGHLIWRFRMWRSDARRRADVPTAGV